MIRRENASKQTKKDITVKTLASDKFNGNSSSKVAAISSGVGRIFNFQNAALHNCTFNS